MQRRMSQAKTAFVLLVVFFAGCAASRILVVPPARAGTNPQRWEYFCKGEAFSDDAVSKMANRAGQEGWEMSSAQGNVWCFKRVLP
jgi:hypothetical protein